MKQTAVDWLIKQLHPTISIRLSDAYIEELIEKAKEMEKQQIIDAHIKGHNAPSSTIKNYDAEQYYNKQYKK